MMDCRQVQPKIADYSVGVLRTREMEQVEQHMAACADCAREWRQMGAVMGLVERLGAQEPPPHLWNGVYNRITQEDVRRAPGFWESLFRGPRRLVAGTASGLVAAALLAAVYFGSGGNTGEPPWAIRDAAGSTASAVQQHALLAGGEPFADEVGLEAYAQLVTRTGGDARPVTR
jgi:anti-sigma factor RsiW